MKNVRDGTILLENKKTYMGDIIWTVKIIFDNSEVLFEYDILKYTYALLY